MPKWGSVFRQLSICLRFSLVALLAQTGAPASAQSWPEHIVKVIVPYPAGGGGDATARIISQKLGELLGQTFVVENRQGASGMVGANAVAKADPDGYTLLVCSPAEISLAPHLFTNMTYDPMTDLRPISMIGWTPLVIIAHPSFPALTPEKFIAHIKANSTDYSHPGVGSSHYLTAEYIKKLVGAQLVPIPYRGAAPALNDAVSGQVKLTISGLPPAVPLLQAGTLKGIAVTSRKRSPLFPDLPALAETKALEDVDTTNWFGVLAPKSTPQPIVDKLNRSIVQALKDERVVSLLKAQALEIVGNSPAEFAAFIRAEHAKYGKIVELTGAKAAN